MPCTEPGRRAAVALAIGGACAALAGCQPGLRAPDSPAQGRVVPAPAFPAPAPATAAPPGAGGPAGTGSTATAGGPSAGAAGPGNVAPLRVPSPPPPAVGAPPPPAPPRAPRYVRLDPPPPPRDAAALRLQAAQRLVAAHPDSTYLRPPVQPLMAIPVLRVELNGDGSVRRVHVVRTPAAAPHTVQLAIDAVHRAAPYGEVWRLPRPWEFIETFLFEYDGRFMPRTLDP